MQSVGEGRHGDGGHRVGERGSQISEEEGTENKEGKEDQEVEEVKEIKESGGRVDRYTRTGEEAGAVHSEDGYAFVGYGAGAGD
jgi:hypothetical protein